MAKRNSKVTGFKDLFITFTELTIDGDTLTDLMLALKKNEPEKFEEVREDLRISMEEHSKKEKV